jgi:hypothetical protein
LFCVENFSSAAFQDAPKKREIRTSPLQAAAPGSRGMDGLNEGWTTRFTDAEHIDVDALRLNLNTR